MIPPKSPSLKADEESPPVFASLFVLVLDVVAYVALLVYTLLSRRPIRGVFEEMEVARPALMDLFLFTPTPLYAGAFLLVIAGLIVKEVAIERKRTTLRINLAALIGSFAILALYAASVLRPMAVLREGR
jgi:hypothetical protein